MRGLKLAFASGFGRIDIESDSQVATNANPSLLCHIHGKANQIV